MKRITFTLPAEFITGLNTRDRMHWGAKHRKQQEMNDRVHLELRSQFPRPIPKYTHASVRMTLHSRHVMDTDNLSACGKPLHDAIVKAGLLPDDSPKYLEVEKPLFEYDKDRRELEVEINIDGEEIHE